MLFLLRLLLLVLLLSWVNASAKNSGATTTTSNNNNNNTLTSLPSSLSSLSSSIQRIIPGDRYIIDDKKRQKRFLQRSINQYCIDLRPNCTERAIAGECGNNNNNINNDPTTTSTLPTSSNTVTLLTRQQRWVRTHCPRSCNACNEIIQLVDREYSFNQIQHRFNKTDINDDEPTTMIIKTAYGRDLGIPQSISHEFSSYKERNEYELIIHSLLETAREYITNEVNVEERYIHVRDKCFNKNEKCVQWTIEGWCNHPKKANTNTKNTKKHNRSDSDNNSNDDNDEEEDYDELYDEMKLLCGPMCQSCHHLHVYAKCPLPHPNDAINAWDPGDLDRMFERIAASDEYDVEVLSRPSQNRKDDGPWVIMINNFINETEADRLIELGSNAGYERSTDLGPVLEDGHYDSKVSNRRTSSNAWCNTFECINDPIRATIYNRMERLTRIPMINSEPFQLLRYEQGQFYKIHNDYIHQDYDRMHGVRILTIFLYLNTISNEGGGGTNFPRLQKTKRDNNNNNNKNVTIQPIRGRAVLWPSVLNDQPHKRDIRTVHQALPVLGADEVKYAANVWIHQREVRHECL